VRGPSFLKKLDDDRGGNVRKFFVPSCDDCE
jgi:hypothetical protein